MKPIARRALLAIGAAGAAAILAVSLVGSPTTANPAAQARIVVSR